MMVNAQHCRFIVNEAKYDETIAGIYLIKACTVRGDPPGICYSFAPPSYLASFSIALRKKEDLVPKC